MKKLVIACILLALAVTAAVWSNAVFKKETEALTVSLERLLDASEHDDDAAISRELENVTAAWENASRVLHALVMHDSMDEVEQSITALPQILKHADREEFKQKCIEALSQTENLVNSERLSWENILKIR